MTKIKPINHRLTLRLPTWLMESIDKERTKAVIPESRNMWVIRALAEHIEHKEKND